MMKDGLSEDISKDGENEAQKLHDKYVKKLEEMVSAKETEIMTV
jgi:ribosome recycling factor